MIHCNCLRIQLNPNNVLPLPRNSFIPNLTHKIPIKSSVSGRISCERALALVIFNIDCNVCRHTCEINSLISITVSKQS